MPEYFTCYNKRIVNKKDIANGFNNFFVNVGPQLAKNIERIDDRDVLDYMNVNMFNSMYLYEVEENELL